MLRLANCRTVVTRAAVASRLKLRAPCLVALDTDETAIARRSPENAGSPAAAESLAYVLFTSGSTGGPKAVGVPHRAIARLVYGLPDVPLGAGARVLHAAPLAFDASTFEIWGPLLHGGCVVIAPDKLFSPLELDELVKSQGVTALWLTSALFNVVIDTHPGALAGVRHVLTGGEALSVSHVERALAALPDVVLINGYGPTEATTFTTYHVIQRDARPRSSIPIGRPLANTRVYVLDEHGRPTPAGFPGELWIGGDGLATGYLNDDELTRERFRDDPFVGGGARMYRSGDRGRFLADGSIEYLGRIDHQLKIRGFRIEPGEIESVLLQHPRVERAAVVATDLAAGRTLVAHIVATDPHAPPSGEDLRAFLRTRLPNHMVPQRYECLEALPLLASGKIDRRALQRRSLEPKPESAAGGDRPLTPTEAVVAATWRQLLDVDGVGRRSHFFESGGDSLLAAQMVSRLESALNVPVAVRSVFEFPTVEALARVLDEAVNLEKDGRTPEWSPLVAIQPAGSRAPLFLVHGIGGEVLSYSALAKHLGTDQPTYGLRANVQELSSFSSVEGMAADYVRAIRQVAPAGPYRIGGYSGGGVIAYEIAQQLRAAGEEVSLLAIIDCWAPGRSARGAISPGAVLKMVRNAAYWVVDDDFLRDRATARGRLASRMIRGRDRLRAVVRPGSRQQEDIRHALGLWRYPESSRAFLEALHRALRTYQPRPYSGTMTVIRSRTQKLMRLRPRVPDMGWRQLVSGRVETRLVPGAHDNIVREPRVRMLAEVLTECLDRAENP
jgi:amino acid adenylation domain-containing protein